MGARIYGVGLCSALCQTESVIYVHSKFSVRCADLARSLGAGVVELNSALPQQTLQAIIAAAGRSVSLRSPIAADVAGAPAA